ncbi:MAG: hypothetical protein GY820_04945 [Gammaproteobacteria bacterium]|nr:hypothetical protein [Gammaproteobacteria bacterium]
MGEGIGIIPGSIIRDKIGTITRVGIQIRIGVIITIPGRISGGMLRAKEDTKGIGGKIIINGWIGMNNHIREIRDINLKISPRGIGIITQGIQITDRQCSN